MKKSLSLIAIGAFALGTVACGGGEKAATPPSEPPKVVEETPVAPSTEAPATPATEAPATPATEAPATTGAPAAAPATGAEAPASK